MAAARVRPAEGAEGIEARPEGRNGEVWGWWRQRQEGIQREAEKELRRRRGERGSSRKAQGRRKSQQRRGMWPGPGCPWAQRLCWGQMAPTSWCADGQAQCLSSLLLAPLGLCPPQGAERWRKTGKPTKISQIGQTCGADKGRAGWDEVSAALRWGGSVRAACGHQNASSPALSGLIVSAAPRRAHAGGSHSEEFGGQSLTSKAPT